MNEIRATHNEAMQCVDLALYAVREGRTVDAVNWWTKALELETKAAGLARHEQSKKILGDSVQAISENLEKAKAELRSMFL